MANNDLASYAAQYKGPAPAPARSMSLSNGEVSQSETIMVDPATLTPGIDRHSVGSVQSSPAPQDGEAAAKITSLEGRIGELINGLGEREAAHKRELQEMQLRFEATMATMVGGSRGPSAPAMEGDSDDEDADAPVSKRALIGALKAFGLQNQIYVNRALLGITPEQEAAVLHAYPFLQNVPEPQKSEFIRRALSLQSEAPNGASAGSANGAAVSVSATPKSPSGQPAVTRPAPRTVPNPEATNAMAWGEEPQPTNPAASAQAEYERAKQIKDPKQRWAAMKAASERAAAAVGVTPETMSQSAWRQR